MIIEAKLESMGHTLPPSSAPMGNYVPCVRTGNLVFVSGTGPGKWPGGSPCTGKLGWNMTVEQGYEAAKLVGLNLIGRLKDFAGDLDKVKQVVKVLGMVNAIPEFIDHPKVINGCSDLLVEVFGDAGKHARAAVGMGSLPGGIPVEIEMVVEVEQ